MDQNNIGLVMAINLGSLNRLTEVSATQEEITLKDLTINTLFSIIMYLVFGFAYVALLIVLLARLVVLWLVIALSPVMALTYVVPQVGQYVSELKLGEKFLQHVMAPIAIGLAMSIGYLMTSQVKSTGGGGLEVGAIGNLKLCQITSGDATGQLLATNINDLQQLIIAAIAVAVVWLGVFGAADKTIANSITNGIKDAGKKAVNFTKDMLKYVPIVPVMTRGKEAEQFSFADISGMLNKVYAVPSMLSDQKVGKYAREWMPSIYGAKDEEFSELMTKFNSGTKQERGETIKTLVQGKISSDAQAKTVAEALRGAGVNVPDDVDTLAEFKKWYMEKGGRQAIGKEFSINLNDTNFTAGTQETGEEATSGTPAKPGQQAGAAGGVNVGQVITTAKEDTAKAAQDRIILNSTGTALTKEQIDQLQSNGKFTAENFTDAGDGKIKVRDDKFYEKPTPAPSEPASPPPPPASSSPSAPPASPPAGSGAGGTGT